MVIDVYIILTVMDAIKITDYIKARESRNASDIFIYFADDGSPIVFKESAALLRRNFPGLQVVRVTCSDGKEHEVIRDFELEPVIEKFMGYHQLVDDRCIHILNVRP